MFMDSKTLLINLLLIAPSLAAESMSPNLGQDATEQSKKPEWNLTITPDGKNLPAGAGTAAEGKLIFAQKCSGCHGPEGIGASAEPLVGEVGSLTSSYPEKTVNSYWPYATTLFDYIRRAMPVDAPFSLSVNEVYALSAYILDRDGIIEPNFELNQYSLPKVTMPNLDGFIPAYPTTLKDLTDERTLYIND